MRSVLPTSFTARSSHHSRTSPDEGRRARALVRAGVVDAGRGARAVAGATGVVVKQRIQITLTFSADLGPSQQATEAWLRIVREALMLAAPQHDPRVAIGTVRVVAPTWKDHYERFGREDT